MHEGEFVLPAALCLISLFPSCSLQEPNDYAPRIDAGLTAQTIGSQGGTVTAEDGTSVLIPPGALTEDVTITIQPNPYAPALTQAQPLAVAHQFGPEGQHFLKPVTVTIEFDPSSLPPGAMEQTIQVWSAPSDSNSYETLPTKLEDSVHVIAQTTDFCNMYPGVSSTGTVVLSAPVKLK